MASSTDESDNLASKKTKSHRSDLSDIEKAWEVILAYRTALRQESPVVDDDNEKQERTKRTVKRILEAAHHVFVNEGHANLSLRKVADHAGIAVGNLTYHFPTKQDLLEATLKESLADYVEKHIGQHRSKETPPLETLLNVVEFYVRNAREHYRFFFQLWGYAGSGDEARKIVGRLYRPIGRFVYYLVRAANPKLSNEQVRRAVLQITSVEEGYKLFIGIGPDNLPELKAAEEDIRAMITRIVENP